MQFREKASPSLVHSLMTVVWMAYAIIPIMGLTLLLFRPSDLRVWFVAGGLALSSLVLIRSIGDMRRFRREDWDGYDATIAFGQGVVALAATGLAVMATDVQGGIFRPLLLLTLVPLAVMGDRRMAFASWFAYLIVLGVVTAVRVDDQIETARILVVDGGVAAVIVVSMSLLMERSSNSRHRSEALAQFAAGLSETNDLASGLASAMDALAQSIDAARVTVLVGPRSGGAPTTVAASWPADGDPLPIDGERVREVAGSGALTVRDGIVYIGGPIAGPVAVVIVAERRHHTWWSEPLDGAVGTTNAALVAALAERTAMVERLADMAHTDDLTGVPNRRSLFDHLDQQLVRSRRDGERFCVAIFDLDHFKRFNDSFGHPAGDRMLKAFASTIADRVRGQDLFARLGGEEFCLILPDTPIEGSVHLINELHRQALPILVGPDGASVTFSVGVAECRHGEDLSALLARADVALYEAKHSGRNQVIADVINLRN